MADPMNADLATLRDEVARLAKIVASQGAKTYGDVRARAGDAYNAAVPQAKRTAAQVKAEGTALADTARQHPAAAGSAIFLAAALGMMIGYALGARAHPQPRYYWWR